VRRGGWLWIIIAMVVVVSLPSLGQRAAIERGNDVVEIVADLDCLRMLSVYTGVPVEQLLADWAARGVTSAGVVDPADLALVERAGLRPVPRTPEVVEALLAQGGAGSLFVAAGEAMPGYPDDLAATAELLRRAGLALGIVEFAEQEGERELARLLGDAAVLVHSIPPRELARLTGEQALARFNRAVLERQARALYVHALVPDEVRQAFAGTAETGAPAVVPLAGPEEARAWLERNGAYVSALVQRVRALGLTVGPVQPLPRWRNGAAVPVLVAAAAAAAALLAGQAFVRLPWRLELGLVTAAGALAAALELAGRDVWARQGAAFAAACAFPVLAVLAGAGEAGGGCRVENGRTDRGRDLVRLAREVARRLGITMTVTLAGAALVAAALGDTRFFLKLELFRGVKAAHLVPIAAVAAAWAMESWPALSEAAAAELARERSGAWDGGVGGRLMARGQALARRIGPFGWKHAAAGLLAAAAVFVLVARTGNNLLPVSSWELAFREALERWLVVRPRTKEFVFGYPALLLGLACFARGRRSWGWPLAVAGVVAPVSVVNTFSHAHVALWVSAVRTAYGLLLGAIVAAAAGAVAAIWRKRLRESAGGTRMRSH